MVVLTAASRGLPPVTPPSARRQQDRPFRPWHFPAPSLQVAASSFSLQPPWFRDTLYVPCFFCFILRNSCRSGRGGRKLLQGWQMREAWQGLVWRKINLNRAKEGQLCKSVFFVSQDWIVGNQQRASVFLQADLRTLQWPQTRCTEAAMEFRNKVGFDKAWCFKFLWYLWTNAQTKQVWDECCRHLAQVTGVVLA